MHDVYGTFGISVFALPGATIDELGNVKPDWPHLCSSELAPPCGGETGCCVARGAFGVAPMG